MKLSLALQLSTFPLLAACAGADARDPQEEVVPAPRRVMSAVADTVLLAAAFDHAKELPRIRRLIVQWKGETVREQYFGGATRASS